MVKLRFVTTMLVLMLAACGGPTTPPPEPNPTPDPVPAPIPDPTPGPGATANNSAVLSGAALGSGITPNSELRREISASVTGENTAFSLDSAYATRTTADSETLYWFITVTNQGSGLQCFVKASVLEFKDTAGQTLTTSDLAFVSGSVGVGSTVYTDTCLGRGETGYFFGIEVADGASTLYSSVDSIVIATLESDAGFSAPAARLIPQSYAVSDEAFSVTVANEGTGAAKLGELSSYFLVDENDLPLEWGFFDGVSGKPDDPVLEAGDTYVLTDFVPLYDGQATKVLAQVTFNDPAAPFSTGLEYRGKAGDAEAARFAAWRSQLEDGKRETLTEQRRSR